MSSSRSFNRRVLHGGARCAVLLLCVLAGSAQALGQTSDAPVIRVWAYSGLSSQLTRWEQGYTRQHPEVRFDNQMHGAAAVMAGLYDGVADVVLMGREIWPVETMAYHWVYQQQPFGVIVATAGLQAPGQLFTPVVMVNAKNPLTAISLSQLDGIYGSEHRAAPANLRTWGDLGLTGEWAARPIHAYGYGGEDALGVFFRHDVLKMDYKPNPESHLLSDRDPGKGLAAARIAEAVAKDPDAIGYARAVRGGEVKVLALGGATPVAATEAALEEHQYPLTRSVWVYFKRMPDKPLEPRVDGFVRYLLGPEAQAMVGPRDQLLALTPAQREKQVHKLDAPMPKGADVEDKE